MFSTKKRHRVLAALAVVAIAGLVVSGCSSSTNDAGGQASDTSSNNTPDPGSNTEENTDDPKTGDVDGTCETTYTIGFSHPFGEAQFVKALKKEVEEFGPEACAKILLDNTTANNLQTQRETVESWITQGVDAIVFWPVEPSAYATLVPTSQAEKNIKWLTYVGPVEGQDGSVGFDPVFEGDAIAADVTEWLAEHYPDNDVEAAVTIQTTQPTIKGRWTQPKDALEKLGVPVVSEQDCSNQACGLEIATNVLRENPNVRVFISYNDDVAIGTQKAIANAGLNADDYYVNGYDGSPEGLEAVKDGSGAFRVTMAIPIADLGHDIVKNAIAAITGEGDPNSLTPDIKVKTGDDEKIDEFLAIFGN